MVIRRGAVPASGRSRTRRVALDLDREIPEPLYRVIAEIYAFVYRLKEHAGSPR
ncbi:MAG: hypothetical protein AB1640_09435 [bacterium]